MLARLRDVIASQIILDIRCKRARVCQQVAVHLRQAGNHRFIVEVPGLGLVPLAPIRRPRVQSEEVVGIPDRQ
ncbi:Uncharacterised protein [Chlamydia trachomatis]|nr:Uncharacterised protein [Chlamydia trachomatis]